MADEVTNDVLVGVLEAAEEAGLGPLTSTAARKLAEGLVARFPTLVTPLPTERPRAAWKRWTPEEEELVVTLYLENPTMPVRDIAEQVGRPFRSVTSLLERRGVCTGDPTGRRPRRAPQ